MAMLESEVGARIWHVCSLDETLQVLQAKPDGPSSEQAALRLRQQRSILIST